MRTPDEMRAKVQAAPNAAGYCFQCEKGFYLDPTDEEGQVSSRPAPGPPWPFDIDPGLAYVNEPPGGRGLAPNVDVTHAPP